MAGAQQAATLRRPKASEQAVYGKALKRLSYPSYVNSERHRRETIGLTPTERTVRTDWPTARTVRSAVVKEAALYGVPILALWAEIYNLERGWEDVVFLEHAIQKTLTKEETEIMDLFMQVTVQKRLAKATPLKENGEVVPLAYVVTSNLDRD